MKIALMILVGFFFCSTNAQAQAPFYQGKTITVIIGTPPGNLYDLWGRLIVEHMPPIISIRS
jgi:tripartite-type tricarboxylate transporter receptor subunit TctC